MIAYNVILDELINDISLLFHLEHVLPKKHDIIYCHLCLLLLYFPDFISEGYVLFS